MHGRLSVMVGGKINKPRAARCKTNSRKSKKLKLKAAGKKTHVRSEETLQSTTKEILRQCRTNPKANVKLSGKKKRLLLREAKRQAAERTQMEVAEEAKTTLEQNDTSVSNNTMDTS